MCGPISMRPEPVTGHHTGAESREQLLGKEKEREFKVTRYSGVVLVVLERQLHHRAGFLNVPRPHLSRWPKHGHVTGCVLPPHNKQGGRRVVFPAVECSARTTVLNHPVLFLFFPSSGKKLGFTIDNGKLHNVSLGQGQEVVAEDALDVAAEKGHWVILQVRALRYHGHVTGDGTEPPIAGAPPLWLSSTEPLQTPSYQLLKGCWGPCRLCSEPRWTNKVDPKAELPTGNTSHQLGSTGWAQRGPPGLEAGLFNGVHPGLGQGSSTGSTRA